MIVSCVKPWYNLGVARNVGTTICCWANGGSPSSPGRISTEISENDWESEHILSKLWNCDFYQQSRSLLAHNNRISACGHTTCTPITEYSIDKNTLTYLQINNLEKANKNIHEKKIAVDHYPISLDLALDGICNLKCRQCTQKLYETPMQKLDIQKFKNELYDFLQHALTIDIIGGEPTVCSDYDLLLNMVKSAGGAKATINTNGHLISKKIIPYIDSFSKIAVSIDAVNANTYDQIRISSNPKIYNWDNILNNLQSLKEARLANQFESVLIFVINGLNYKDMNEMIDLSVYYGIDTVCITETINDVYNKYDCDNDTRQNLFLWTHHNPTITTKHLNEAILYAASKPINIYYMFPSLNRTGFQPKN